MRRTRSPSTPASTPIIARNATSSPGTGTALTVVAGGAIPIICWIHGSARNAAQADRPVNTPPRSRASSPPEIATSAKNGTNWLSRPPVTAAIAVTSTRSTLI